MSKFYKIIFCLSFLGVVWLGLRDISSDRSGFVSFADYTNEVAVLRSAFLSLRNGSECLKSNYVNLSNYVHGLGVKFIGAVRNNLAPNNGFQGDNDLKSIQQDRYIRGSYQYVSIGSLSYLVFDGCDFRLGSPCEFGRVVVIDRNFTICIDENGSKTFLLPLKQDSTPRASPPSPASLQGGHGERARGPWYYVHTGTDKE